MWYSVRRRHKRGLAQALSDLIDQTMIEAARERMADAPARPDLAVKTQAAKLAVLCGARAPFLEVLHPKARRFVASLSKVRSFQNETSITCAQLCGEAWALAVVLKGSLNVETAPHQHTHISTATLEPGDWFGCLEPKSSGEGVIELEGMQATSAAEVCTEGGAMVLVMPSSIIDLAHKGGKGAESLYTISTMAAGCGLGSFSLKQLQPLAGLLQPVNFKQNDRLYTQGGPAMTAILIKEGTVDLVFRFEVFKYGVSLGKKQQIVLVLGPGCIVGTSALLPGTVRVHVTVLYSTLLFQVLYEFIRHQLSVPPI